MTEKRTYQNEKIESSRKFYFLRIEEKEENALEERELLSFGCSSVLSI